MNKREKVISGLECCILREPDDNVRCGECPYNEPNTYCLNRLKMDALSALKDGRQQDEGWLCIKRTSGLQKNDLLCACGNKLYFTTLLFEDGFTANELHCPNCGLSMRSPGTDKDGVWLKKHWEEVVLRAQQPRVMTLSEMNEKRGRGEAVYYEDRDATCKSQDVFVVAPGKDLDVVWLKAETVNLVAKMSTMGKTWRCWTSRPTDEQRERTPWA